MAGLKNIKHKIQSVKKTSTVTRAMEAVSAVKMRKSQERALGGRAYAATSLSLLERLSGTNDLSSYPLMQPQGGKTCVVIITSDKGLAGALNSGVIRAVERMGLSPENSVIIAMGRRGGDFFLNRRFDVRIKKENVSDGVSEIDLQSVTEAILAMRASGEVGNCFIAYANFLSTFEQEPVVRQIIPITKETMKEIVAHIRPVRGKYAPAKHDAAAPSFYTIEPSADAVLSQLLPKLLNVAVFYALLEAKASEHSARMVAMKNATDKAKELAKALTRKFNRIRQASITREVSEIVGGIEAMK
ncbi:ATP synthase F1 subunit gamma [bacterium]|nr:ATP synthase F1 subunit gamma [bacterium]